jgi:hypothetical protein
MYAFPRIPNNIKKIQSLVITLILVIGSLFIVIDFNPNSSALKYGQNTDLSDSNIIFQGEGAYDEAARSVSLSPDINGDGIDDLLIGAEFFDKGADKDIGKSYIFFGHSTTWAYHQYLFNAPSSFIGENARDHAGIITPAGDVNGDGLTDILIGAPYNDDGGGLSTIWTDGAGQVYLILGKSTGLEPNIPLSKADASYLGEEVYDNVGFHISTAGDFNGDGFDDFLISTPNMDEKATDAGKVYMVFGKESDWAMDFNLSDAESSYMGETQSDKLHVVSNAGDINMDGYDDILLGSPGNDDAGTDAGKVYLIYGYPGGWKADVSIETAANASFIGEKAGDQLSKVSAVGDVNHDGFDDFMIGAPLNNEGGTNAGKSYLIYGQSEPFKKNTDISNLNSTFVGENANDNAANVAGIGDINGDGFSDFIIAAPYNDSWVGVLNGKPVPMLRIVIQVFFPARAAERPVNFMADINPATLITMGSMMF